MAGSVNKVILIGHLGRDPEVRTSQAGNKIVNLSVATSETWKDRTSGERQERTEWHRVVIFNDRLAETAERRLRKGAQVYLEGQLATRKWTDQAGTEKYTTEVVLKQFRGELTMLGGRRDGGDPGAQPEDYAGTPRPAARGQGPAGDAPGRRGGYGDLDDEIPF